MKTLILNCSPVRDGATAFICALAAEVMSERGEVRSVCINDYSFSFCRGCRSCHLTGKCVMSDGVDKLMAELDEADRILFVSPSYWADVPGQFKAFIDRCTPWSNTHEPHASLRGGKLSYSIVLRTGGGMKECERLISTIEHYCGHLEITPSGSLALCSVDGKAAAEARSEEIISFCRGML
ncbi:MAG: flavodoxin family protein [Ruminococcus sp.]|nr:flavodoxin family protein [Ruminococcus sp.]